MISKIILSKVRYRLEILERDHTIEMRKSAHMYDILVYLRV